jgi:asparagine synthase (glutamine-hydrolysing)
MDSNKARRKSIIDLTYFLMPLSVKKKVARNVKGHLQAKFIKENIDSSVILNELHNSKDLTAACLNHFKYKLEHLLLWEDRNSMFHSIESRVPFLDFRIVEKAINTKSTWKLRNGKTKYILREALKDILPDQILNRTEKIGFATPEDVWMRSDLFLDLINKKMGKGSIFEYGYVDKLKFNKLIELHRNGSSDNSRDIWRCFNLEVWLNKYIS